MRIITRATLKAFWENHPDAEEPLQAWYRIAKAARWGSIAEIRRTFPTADPVGKCIVFNIGGNKYRLVVTHKLKYGVFYIRRVMTHAEYSKNRWQENCGCQS